MEIIIGADIVPTNSNKNAFVNADVNSLVDKTLQNVLKTADYRIFNLEVPLTDKKNPIAKCGPNLIAQKNTVNGIMSLGVDFLTLANNHIMDQGEDGLKDTIQILDEKKIAHAGAAFSKEEAAKPFMMEKDGMRVGIYCCAEHEFSIISDSMAGANPFDPLWSLDHIQELKNKCDYVIVLYHGGKEQYRYPSPQLQQVCRRIVDKGADLVICQHTHCVGCREEWKQGTIVYGQGNFLFDDCDNEYWKTSLLVSIVFHENKSTIKYLPLCKVGASVSLAVGKEKEDILKGFEVRSNEIKQKGFINREYAKYAESMLPDYLNRTLGQVHKNLIFRVLNKFMGNKLRQKCYSGSNALALINTIECEPHRELFIEGLRNYEK